MDKPADQDSAFFSDSGSKICEKPDPEAFVIFGSSTSLRGLSACHFLSTNIAEFRLHR